MPNNVDVKNHRLDYDLVLGNHEPDQVMQLNLAKDLLEQMGIPSSSVSINNTSESKSERKYSLDILGGLENAQTIRLSGIAGNNGSITFSLIETSTGKSLPSSLSGNEDGEKIFKIIRHFNHKSISSFNEQNGSVEICLPEDHALIHSVALGNFEFVGIEFLPIVRNDNKSPTIHGKIAFLYNQ